MSNYILGGWSQHLKTPAPASFSYAIYGMVTNLTDLKTGLPGGYGWSPATTPPPASPGSVMWAYGGDRCTPVAEPANQSAIDAINAATRDMGWAGVDFDDECKMNTGNIVLAMQKMAGLETSYTFLAGWDYNNPTDEPDDKGRLINAAVAEIAQSGACQRFCLMCYGEEMYSMPDIVANVGPAIARTIAHVGDPKKVILALTPEKLDAENLAYFLDQVKSNNIGGLFVWEYSTLSPEDLNTIETALNIETPSSSHCRPMLTSE